MVKLTIQTQGKKTNDWSIK